MLSAGVLSESNMKFMEPAMSLDGTSQLEIEQMLAHVLKYCTTIRDVDKSFYNILSQHLGRICSILLLIYSWFNVLYEIV